MALRLLDLLRDPEVSTPELVSALRADPALAARILRAANSTYFGFRAEVRTLEQAVPLVGRTVVTSLALSFSLAEAALDRGRLAADFREYWVRSLVQGSAAELLARHGAPGLPAELFMTGLLMDLGQLAMLKVLGARYAQLLRASGGHGGLLCRKEEEELGFTHAQVGAALMERWSLPASMVTACRHHHDSAASPPEALEEGKLVAAVRVAAAVADWYGGGSPAEELTLLAELTEAHFGFSEPLLLRYLMETDARILETAELFPLPTPDLPSASDLMAQASEQLASVVISQEKERQRAVSLRELAEERREELETQNALLRRQVFMDPLTGVHNRRFFDEMLEHEIRRSARKGTDLSLLFVDVDRFKEVNDTWGHLFGDEVLTRIGGVLRSACRTSDVVARFGGEEFVVLAHDTGADGLRLLGERLRAAVEALPLEQEGERVPVTVSVGGVTRGPDASGPRSARALVDQADRALYGAKEAG
ncbi:MAG: GGDEF domain-containing protein, partial [Gemmatimonadales bacterium]